MYRLTTVLPLAFALLAPDATVAASRCDDRAKVVARLAEKYGEEVQSMGLNASNHVVEIYASEDTGTWTILATRPDGVACLIASGHLWEADAAPFMPQGDDT